MGQIELLQVIDKIGALGLGFMVWALMTGRLVTRREHEREIARGDRLEVRLEKALDYGARGIAAGEQLAAKK